MRKLKDLNLTNTRVLMRLDLNVPLQNGRIADDFRIRAALPTIEYCLSRNAAIVIMSHLGRPGGIYQNELSLVPVGETLSDLLECPVKFSDSCVSPDAIAVSKELRSGEIHLLENLRFFEEETENDIRFAEKLSYHGKVYVNDAFGTAHRAHASNVGVAEKFQEKAMGLLMEREWEYLHHTLKEPARPLTIVLGGAKISGKLELIGRFIRSADNILIGGGMSFTFLKAKGVEIGSSLLQEDMLSSARLYLLRAEQKGAKLLLPVDCAVDNNSIRKIIMIDQLSPNDKGLDIGPETIRIFREMIRQSKTVVWNGPMGVYEDKKFVLGTQEICEEISKVSDRGGQSIIGGGDSAAAVRAFGMEQSMSHISTGGGASLELLAGRTLPALRALEV
ncbi:MAG: phosphoglycerate kinase [Fidelibacterota bacterium]